jgi:hypothetical protein
MGTSVREKLSKPIRASSPGMAVVKTRPWRAASWFAVAGLGRRIVACPVIPDVLGGNMKLGSRRQLHSFHLQFPVQAL